LVQNATIADKTEWNRISKILIDKIKKVKNETFKSYLSGISAINNIYYSLGKTIRCIIRPRVRVPPNLKQHGTWAHMEQNKADVYSGYLVPLP
jgi:hypothetical protein